jgi:flagellar motor switch protein FliN/FliY
VTGFLSQEEIDALLKGSKEAPPGRAEGKNVTDTQRMETRRTPLVEKVQFASLQPRRRVTTPKVELDFFKNIPLLLSCELGTATITVRELLNLDEGSVIKLNKVAGDSSTLLVNEQYLAQAEVVIINERFGVRVTSIGLEEKIEAKGAPEKDTVETTQALETRLDVPQKEEGNIGPVSSGEGNK